jgi:hypothetical protein
MAQGCLQGNQIAAFFQKGVRGKGMPEIVEPETLDAQLFQKCSPSPVDANKSFPGFWIFKNVLAAVPAVMELVKQFTQRLVKRYHPDFPVFAPLCLYSDKSFFQVNLVPFKV